MALPRFETMFPEQGLLIYLIFLMVGKLLKFCQRKRRYQNRICDSILLSTSYPGSISYLHRKSINLALPVLNRDVFATKSPFQFQIPRSVLKRPLRATWALLLWPKWLAAAVCEPMRIVLTESDWCCIDHGKILTKISDKKRLIYHIHALAITLQSGFAVVTSQWSHTRLDNISITTQWSNY